MRGPSQRLCQLVDRVRRVGVHLPVAGLARAARGLDQSDRRLELADQPVDVRSRRSRRAGFPDPRRDVARNNGAARPSRSFSLTASACGTSVRISNIAICGSHRMKSEKNVKNKPSDPAKNRCPMVG